LTRSLPGGTSAAMHARWFAAYLFLALVAVSQCGIALDRASSHSAAVEQRWQASTHHPNAPRLPQRHASWIPGDAPSFPPLDRLENVPPVLLSDPGSPFLAGIFVPPRV